ncbi:MAG: dUTP diphosphatase [Thermoleophilaceae bacterium]|nr:dUTP diphosphatase [Thermoleophilaceae bacterium]
MELQFQKMSADATVPTQSHPGDAGFDLYACKEAVLTPGARTKVHIGIAVAIPVGHAGLIIPRSGLANKHGITLVNSPGLIDCGYRGELQVLLLNTDQERNYEVSVGDRVGQLVIIKVELPKWTEVTSLDETVRGEQGFGSSGL